jgi:hypothetical protein
MALINIEYGSIASSKLLNDNFNYLEDKIEDYSKNIATDKASLMSLINSQIETVITQFSSKLQTMYPVGSMYIGLTDTCPIANLFGTWEKVAEGLCLQGATNEQIPGTAVEAGLPEIQSTFQADMNSANGAIKLGSTVISELADYNNSGGVGHLYNATFRASYSNSTYGKSNTVQPPAYLVNIWRRTA